MEILLVLFHQVRGTQYFPVAYCFDCFSVNLEGTKRRYWRVVFPLTLKLPTEKAYVDLNSELRSGMHHRH